MRKGINLKKFELIKNWPLYLMMLPAFALFFLFAYIPMSGVYLAFTKYTVDGGIFGSAFVGWDNFKLFFASSDYGRLTRNILLYNGIAMILGTVTTVGSAILLDQLFSRRVRKFYQTVIFLPYFLSILVVVRIVDLYLNDNFGIVNNILKAGGLSPVSWSLKSLVWVFILAFSACWKGIGYGTIVYLAVITGFDETLYEAAKIDGAGRLKQIRHITLPLLLPTVIILQLMAVGRIFYGDFMFVYSFVGDRYEMKKYLDIIETYLFRNLVGGVAGSTPDYGMNAVVGLYQSVLGFAVIFTANFIVKRINKDWALF